MEKGTDEENSDVPDTTDDEQKIEEGDVTEETPADNGTPVTDEGAVSEDDNANETTTEPAEEPAEEVVTPSEKFDEAEEPEEEESDSFAENKTDALEQETKTKILIKGVVLGGEDGKTEVLEETLSTAELQFTDGCASNDGTQVRADSDITFRILPKEGYMVDSVKFGAAEKEEDLGKLSAANKGISADKNGIYLIGKGEINKGEKKFNALIVVKTVKTKFTVKAGSVNGLALNTIEEKTAEGSDPTQELKAFTSKEYAYDEANSIEFALTGMATGTTYKVTAQAEGGKVSDPLTAGEEETLGDKKYIPYTLNVFELDGYEKYKNQNITINVTPDEVVSIAGSPVIYTPAAYTDKVSAPKNLPDDATEKKIVAFSESGSFKPGDTVVFAVKNPVEGSVWEKITADDIETTLVDSNDSAVVLEEYAISASESDITEEGAVVYDVALPDDVAKSCTLKIAINAKMNDTAKKVTFKLDLPSGVSSDVVTLKSGGDKITAEQEYRTDGESYPVSIESKEGYQLTDVVVKLTGTYDNEAKDSYDNGDGITLEDSGEDKDYPRYQLAGSINFKGIEDREGDHKGQKWTATVAEVTVKVAEVEGAEEEKQIAFTSIAANAGDVTAAHPYAFEVEVDKETGSVKYTETNATSGTAKIAKGTKYLNFSVKADTEPEITFKTDKSNAENDNDLLELVSQDGGTFNYRVAAKAIVDVKGSITINRPKKSITAKFDQAVVNFTNMEDDKDEYDEYPIYELADEDPMNVDIDAPLSITVARVSERTAPIASVTYKIGTGKDAVEGTAQSDGEGGFFFEVKASNDIEITVNNEAQERLFVNGEEREAGETVEIHDYEQTITASLKDKANNNIPLYNATVYEGTTLAETVAKIDPLTNVVSINVAKKEREKELTVTLLKQDRTAVSFKIVSDKAVEEVSYTKLDGTAVSGTVSMNEDTKLRLRINAKDGAKDKMRAVVVETGDKDPETVPKGASGTGKNITANISGDVLEITALETDKAVEKAGTVLLYEVGDGEAILKGSILNVSVKEPLMKGETAKAAFKSATARDITISIEVPNYVREEQLVNNGKPYYKLNVTATLPASVEGLTSDEWKLTKKNIEENLKLLKDKKLRLSEINNGYTITLIDKDKKAAKIDGFKITVTPAQMVKGKEITGTPCTEITAGTTAPLYTDTLKLKSVNKTLITGQNEDVVVAIPTFPDNAQYRKVEVEMIDSTTGVKSGYHEDDGEDNDGFAPKWDAVNGWVTVNAGNADYDNNAYGYYKNLAVKITAYTEDGDHGVSGIQKLSVINGIQNMSVSVQPEILKADAKKKVTVKTSVVFNNEDDKEWGKKYAPKKKMVEYSLAGSADGAALNAKLQGNVTINQKTGQITVEKDFVPSEKEAENTFYVIAKAADYTGNLRKKASNRILITTKDTAAGEVALFEAGTDKAGNADWSKAVKVSAGDLQVCGTKGQYRLAMLKPTAPAKSTYNLNTGNDFVGNDLFSIKASSKNVDVHPFTGAITVKKLGKVTFTMTAKSNTKKKYKSGNYNFIAEKTDLYVEVNQYQDSTFEQKTADTRHVKDSESIEVNGNTTSYFELKLVKQSVDEKGNVVDWVDFALPNCTFSVKNGKKVTPAPAYRYKSPAYIMATGTTGKKATVVTVTDKSVKPNKKIEITISNPTADSLTGNAPKIALTDKKTRIPAGEDISVSLTVTAGKKGESIPENTYVMLSADQSKKTKANVNDVFDRYLETAIPLAKTDASTGTFSIRMTDESQAEAYNLIATLGTLKNGEFKQTHKEARVTLKAVKPNSNIKATSKYTLNPYGVSTQKLIVDGGDYRVDFVNGAIQQEVKHGKDKWTLDNYAKNIIQKDGKPNEFNKYFFVNYDENGNVGVIGINPALSSDELKKLEDKDFLKTNGTGYITLTNDKKVVDVKLTVAVNGKDKIKLKASAASVLAGKDVLTDVQILDGKTPVAIAAYTADGTTFKQYYDEATLGKNKVERDAEEARLKKGIIRMKAAEAAKGEDKLTLRVLPEGMAEACWYVEDSLKDYGIDISNVKVKIEAADKKNKVSLAAADKKWKVESRDWAATAEKAGWETERAYTFTNRLGVEYVTDKKDSGQVIKVDTKTPYVKFVSDNYSADGVQKLTIFLDKAELVKAQAADPKKLKAGKTVKVDAIFTYPSKEDETKSILTEDKVTFNITLPDEEGYPDAGSLIAAVESMKEDLAEFVEIKTTQYQNKLYHWYNGKQYKEQDLADEVAADLEALVLDMAQGTTAVIGATGTFKSRVYSYELTVDGNKWPFTTYGQVDVSRVLQILTSEGYLSITEKEKADKLGLAYRNITTDETLTVNLNKVLKDKGVLTNNIIVTAKVNADEVKAPTVGNDWKNKGYFEATVTVINKNYEPVGEADYNYMAEGTLTYKFDALKATNTYTGTFGTKLGIAGVDAEKDLPAVADMTKLDYLFSESYNANKDGIGKDNKISDDMLKTLEEKIKVYAEELIKENEYLGVKEIKGLKCTPAVDNWTVEFTIVYTDESPKAKESGETEIPVELTTEKSAALTVTAAKVARLQYADNIKFRAEKAFTDERMLLDKAETKDDAIKAITEMIEKVCLNPNYADYAEKDKVKVTAKDEDFVKPEGENNGQITVSVNFGKTKDGGKVEGEYTFVILADNDLKGETPGENENDPATPNLTDAKKYEGLVKAALTESRVNTLVQNAWKAFAETDTNNWTKFITAGVSGGLDETIEKAVMTSLLGHSGVKLPDSGGVEITGTPTQPKSEKDADKAGKIEGITAHVVDSNGGKLVDVEISEITLNPHAVFQSEDEFIDAVVKDLEENGIDYSGTFITENATSKEPEIIGANQAKALDAITDHAASGKLAKNPEWKQETFVSTINAAAKEDGEESENTNFTNVTLIENVQLTIGNAKGDDVEVVDVKVKTKEQTALITEAKLTKVGDVEATTSADGTKEKPIKVTASTDKKDGDKLPLTVQMKLTSSSGSFVDAEEVEWGDIKSVVNDTDADLTDGLEGVVITGDELVIPQGAYVDGGKVLVKLSGTVKDAKALEEDNNKVTSYVEITLPEKVEITLKADSKEVNTEEDMTIEADAKIETTVAFAAELTGSHFDKDTKKAIITYPKEQIDGLTFEQTEGAKEALTLKVAPTLAETKTVKLTVSAQENTVTVTEEVTLTIKPNKTVVGGLTLKLDPDGTDAKWDDPSGEGKNGTLTVQNATDKELSIPIDGTEGRTWDTENSTVTVAGIELDETKPEIKLVQAEAGDKLNLVIANELEAIPAAFKPEEGDKTPEVKATTLTLSLKTTAGNGQAAIETVLTFDIVVKRTITDVKIEHDGIAAGDAVGSLKNGMWEVTKASGKATTVTLKATLEGAHVKENTGVTWKIISKGAKSKATIKNGVVTIPETGSVDNTITVQATTKDKNEDGKTVSGTYTIKVVK